MSVPRNTSDASIATVLKAQYAWICRQAARASIKESMQPTSSTSALKLWGECLPVRLVSGLRCQVYVQDGAVCVASPQPLNDSKILGLLQKFQLEQLQAEVTSLWDSCQNLVGVRASSWHWRDMTSRWGSCNTRTGRICLNSQLIRFPHHCLRYVLIHELVHLRVRPHNREFYAYMDCFCPSWREIRRKLNKS